ncbi:helix-hairpin-helix domain-containing protein [Sinomonas mesophila]|uniref:helix-hairpin-helix domain-containing protein n=1 Tax=Sinomonas mesophila TaxID=1531955 RepID=UPI001FE342AD|nr:helix-hairpin-helix domain-containing protein [Sinomonas mesophila]
MVTLRAAAALAVVLAICSGLWWWSSASAAPDVRTVEAADEAEAGHGEALKPEPEPGEEPAAGDALVAHVAGAVAAPGVYRLPRGARYHEAIAAAGGAGPEADVHRLNLAAAVEDGMRLYVPRIGEAVDPAASGMPAAGGGAALPGGPVGRGSAGGTAAGGRAAKVNLNTATVEELGALPRVGPVLAQRIVDFRTQHGRFGAPEDLDAVDGIGPKMLETLLPLVTV